MSLDGTEEILLGSPHFIITARSHAKCKHTDKALISIAKSL